MGSAVSIGCAGESGRLVISNDEVDEVGVCPFVAWAPPVRLSLVLVAVVVGASALAGAFFVVFAAGRVANQKTEEKLM